MTTQDRKAIEETLGFETGYEPAEHIIDAIEALIEQARAEGAVEGMLALANADPRDDERRQASSYRLIAALLRSRRIDRAVIQAVNREAESWYIPESGRFDADEYDEAQSDAYERITTAMDRAERTAREEIRRAE